MICEKLTNLIDYIYNLFYDTVILNKLIMAHLQELSLSQLEANRQHVLTCPIQVEVVPCPPTEAYVGLTVNNLKQQIQSYNIKPPNVNKALLIQFLRLVRRLSTRQALHNAVRSTFKLTYFTWGPAGKEGILSPNWLEHLYQYGFTTVPILSQSEAEYFRREIIHYAENLHSSKTNQRTSFRESNIQSWELSNYTVPSMHGLIKEHCAHTQIKAWLRFRTAHIFAKIWGCSIEHLRMPLDSFCILPPAPVKENSWIHCDCPYDPSRQIPYDICSVQSMLNLGLANEPRGSFMCIPNSNHVYRRYVERNPPTYIAGFGKTNLDDPELARLPIAKVCAQPGVLILWLTSVPHANTPAPCPANNLTLKAKLGLRVTAALTAFPYHHELQQNRYARARAYWRGQSTGHWLYGPGFGISKPYYRNGESWKPGPNQVMGPPPEMLELYRHWFGYYDLTSEERQKLALDTNLPEWMSQSQVDWRTQLPL